MIVQPIIREWGTVRLAGGYHHFDQKGWALLMGGRNTPRADAVMRLSLEPGNRYDSNAIRLDYAENPQEQMKVGWIPKEQNSELNKILAKGDTIAVAQFIRGDISSPLTLSNVRYAHIKVWLITFPSSCLRQLPNDLQFVCTQVFAKNIIDVLPKMYQSFDVDVSDVGIQGGTTFTGTISSSVLAASTINIQAGWSIPPSDKECITKIDLYDPSTWGGAFMVLA